MSSGTDTRQRGVSISARFNDLEAACLREAADRAGVSMASLIRMAVLDEPRARATRRPPVATATLARLIHDLGPIADTLRQIASHAGSGEDDPRLTAALDQLADMTFVCLEAMRRVPRRPPHTRVEADAAATLDASWAEANPALIDLDDTPPPEVLSAAWTRALARVDDPDAEQPPPLALPPDGMAPP